MKIEQAQIIAGSFVELNMGNEVIGSTVVLTTAHVWDDRPEAASLLNLAALYQKCHNGHDAKTRQERRKERLRHESCRRN